MYQDVGKTVLTCTKYTINSSKVWKQKKTEQLELQQMIQSMVFNFIHQWHKENVTVHNNSTSFMALIMLKNTRTCS